MRKMHSPASLFFPLGNFPLKTFPTLACMDVLSWEERKGQRKQRRGGRGERGKAGGREGPEGVRNERRASHYHSDVIQTSSLVQIGQHTNFHGPWYLAKTQTSTQLLVNAPLKCSSISGASVIITLKSVCSQLMVVATSALGCKQHGHSMAIHLRSTLSSVLT